MRVFSAGETRDLLPFGPLIEALREMFRTGAAAPCGITIRSRWRGSPTQPCC